MTVLLAILAPCVLFCVWMALVHAIQRDQEPRQEQAARDLVQHIARMQERWADMGAEDPDARNRELWAPLHRKADALRDLLPGEAAS